MSPDFNMRQTLGHVQRLEQRMLLTPQLIQSVEMLQLPIMELSQKVDEMLEENPFLELDEETSEGDEVEAELSEQEWVEDADTNEALKEEHPEAELKSGEDAEDDVEDFSKVDKLEFEDDFGPVRDGPPVGSLDNDPKWDALQNTPNLDESLYEHLEAQIDTSNASERIRALALRIAASLDRDGYLRMSLDDALAPTDEETREGTYSPPGEQDAQEALSLVKSLDPPGIGAADLKECLLLQLDDRGNIDDLVRSVVSGHLDDIIHNRLPKVASALNVSIEDIKYVVYVLGRFTPFPGRLYSQEPRQYVSPDIVVRRSGDEYDVTVNESFLPTVRVSNRYRGVIEDTDDESREFLRRKYQEARQLRQNIAQRRSTLQRIAVELADAQQEFLEKGEAFLRPMQMQTLAEKLVLHVSTISRAVADKYIDTPVGVFPLRKFFSSGYTRRSSGLGDDKELSNQAVMKMVREVIDNEDKMKPLSDKAIADTIAAKGIKIARRTVAKYRETLGILAARQRREY